MFLVRPTLLAGLLCLAMVTTASKSPLLSIKPTLTPTMSLLTGNPATELAGKATISGQNSRKKSNRYGELRLPLSSLVFGQSKNRFNNFGFPLAFSASQVVPTMTSLTSTGAALTSERGSRLKSILRPRKPSGVAASLASSLQSTSFGPELGLTVYPGAPKLAGGYSVFRKYRGRRIPRLPISIKGALFSSAPKDPVFGSKLKLPYSTFIPSYSLTPPKYASHVPLAVAQSLKPHKAKQYIDWAYLKRPKAIKFAPESFVGSPDSIPLISSPAPEPKPEIVMFLPQQHQQLAPPGVRPTHYKQNSDNPHYLEAQGPVINEGDDDSQFPKANAPILPSEPLAEPQGHHHGHYQHIQHQAQQPAQSQIPVAGHSVPEPTGPPQYGALEQGLQYQEQQASPVSHDIQVGQVPEASQQLQQQEEAGQAGQEETQHLPVFHERPMNIRQQRTRSLQQQALRGPFEALAALSSNPEAVSSLASMALPYLSRPDVSIEQLVDSVFREATAPVVHRRPPPALTMIRQTEQVFVPRQPQRLRGMVRLPQRGNNERGQFQGQRGQAPRQFRPQYSSAPFGHPPPSYENILVNKERTPLRTYASGWVPKDLPHDWQPGPIRVAPGHTSGLYTTPTIFVPSSTSTTTTPRPPGGHPIQRPTSPVPATKPIKQVIRIYLTQPPIESPGVSTSTTTTTTTERSPVSTRALPRAPPSTTSTSTTTVASSSEESVVTEASREAREFAANEDLLRPTTIDLVRTTESPREELDSLVPAEAQSNAEVEVFSDIPRIDKKSDPRYQLVINLSKNIKENGSDEDEDGFTLHFTRESRAPTHLEAEGAQLK